MKSPFAPLFDVDYLVRSLVLWPALVWLSSGLLFLSVNYLFSLDYGYLLVFILPPPIWGMLVAGTLILWGLDPKLPHSRTFRGAIIAGVYALLGVLAIGLISYGLEIEDALLVAPLAAWGALFVGVKALQDIRQMAKAVALH